MAFLTIAGGSAWLGVGGSVRDLTVSRSRIVVPLKTHLPLTSRLGLLILNQVGQKKPFLIRFFWLQLEKLPTGGIGLG